jgi:hypothetical protein
MIGWLQPLANDLWVSNHNVAHPMKGQTEQKSTTEAMGPKFSIVWGGYGLFAIEWIRSISIGIVLYSCHPAIQ